MHNYQWSIKTIDDILDKIGSQPLDVSTGDGSKNLEKIFVEYNHHMINYIKSNKEKSPSILLNGKKVYISIPVNYLLKGKPVFIVDSNKTFHDYLLNTYKARYLKNWVGNIYLAYYKPYYDARSVKYSLIVGKPDIISFDKCIELYELKSLYVDKDKPIIEKLNEVIESASNQVLIYLYLAEKMMDNKIIEKECTNGYIVLALYSRFEYQLGLVLNKIIKNHKNGLKILNSPTNNSRYQTLKIDNGEYYYFFLKKQISYSKEEFKKIEGMIEKSEKEILRYWNAL
ncbi:hypothetical protein MJ1_0562 [Nanobdella aerobiophila]|uniref:Uncharacterized protein n=1 Tax=Nanobdella aerobiophila TaxID=2586965 RepID=A0A915SKK7_9ARCH|nr:hypothetical protein [Nanobdella aerobiophila]BBL45713.1 hypothetical protein MJ1_0562 [Nanobdella aerobiophila]